MFWVHQPAYVLVCVAVSTLVFFSAHIPELRYRLLLWFDAAGLALFATIGAEKGLEAGTGPVVAVFMGIITATFGGIIRDVLGGEVPLILARRSMSRPRCWSCNIHRGSAHRFAAVAAFASGFFACFALRALALRYGWSLPPYRARAGPICRE